MLELNNKNNFYIKSQNYNSIPDFQILKHLYKFSNYQIRHLLIHYKIVFGNYYFFLKKTFYWILVSLNQELYLYISYNLEYCQNEKK